MANLRDLNKRRKSASSTRKITRTMELVASAKLKKAMEAASASRPYAEGLRTVLARVRAAAGSDAKHPLLTQRPVKQALICVASSDRGLCGAFNANLVSLALSRGRELEAQGARVQYLALGKKGGSNLVFFGRQPVTVHQKLVGGAYAVAEPVASDLIKRFTAGEYDRIEIVYPRFVSQVRQVPEAVALLPAGASDDGAEKPKGAQASMLFAPEPEELLAALVPLAVKSQFFSCLLQTSAAEHAARRVDLVDRQLLGLDANDAGTHAGCPRSGQNRLRRRKMAHM